MHLPRRIPLLLWLVTLAGLGFPASALAQDNRKNPKLELRPGDRLSLIGNALADRMQHDGWLETYFHARLPRHDLVFRNLGFTGDEVELSKRMRSARFGSPDEWLTRTRTDVIFAFFGHNESFAGEEGVGRFKANLASFVKETLGKKYNGTSAPRLVLFTPVACEDLKDRNLPDPAAVNRRLAPYAAAVIQVARDAGVPCVDLFSTTKAAYEKAKKPLTINGVHLNERGHEAVARIIVEALLGKDPQALDPRGLDALRQAVIDRNFHWFQRYRTTDGYSIYGGRADLKFVAGQTNREVMQREMEVLDVMTANRDRRIWAVARGGDLRVDDSNTPPFLEVKTNRPGPLAGGKHLFLDGEQAIEQMKVARGMKVNLFASEKQFPDLVNPVQMSWDTRGRLWVAVWPTYPHWKPREKMNDKLLILEDTNGDGKADKCTVFADNLHCPTGFEFYNGGVLVAQAPDLMFLKDTNGDDKADVRERVLGGIDSADTHHTANSFVLDPGGALYFQEGTFHQSQIESAWAAPQRCSNAGVFRYEPRSQKVDVYISFGFANPHGHVFDRWGQDIVVDGTGSQPYHAALFSGQVDFPHKHGRPPQVYKQRTRPCPGMEILSSRHFPEENQGNLLVANVIGFQGILQYRIQDNGASFSGFEVEPIVSSKDPNFRPSDLKIGPDGALYFIDWHNPIIGHMQHNLRDPSRDREHGRIYRVTYPSRPLLKPVKIAGEPIEKLLELLKEPEDRVRYRVRIELGGRETDRVIAALRKWMQDLDPRHKDYEHHMMEALWAFQYQNVVDEALLKRMLRSSDFRARAAATRVLCYWRDRVREPLKLLQVQINDPHPRVRLEAIRALSFFHDEAAVAVAVEMLGHPDDEYLRFTFNETLNTLERRLGGGRLDRRNLAASLLKMLDQERLPAARKMTLVETICRHGGEKELVRVWEQASKNVNTPLALRRRMLEGLTEAALTRKIQPAAEAEAVRKLLAGAGPELLPEAIRLAAAWKIKETAADMEKLARAVKTPPEARKAAIEGLASLGDAGSLKVLRELAGANHPIAVRYQAAAALAPFDVEAAARLAAAAIAAASEADDPEPLLDGFLALKDGSDKLAAALSKEKVKPDVGKRLMRAMFLAGRTDAALTEVIGKHAGLESAWKAPSAREIEQVVAEVKAKGDASRGERIFRRLDLGCLKCHAINKAGGQVGPDLGPIGNSSPVDYIVTSILDPNQAIKEEYLTRNVTTTRGKLHTGIVVQRDKNQLVLKDATGKMIRIPTANIDSETAGKSLMPEGITRILTRAEMLDLMKFVSELGKQGGSYAPRATPTVLRWKKLKQVPDALKEGVPNRDVLRDTVLRAAPEAWESVFTLVNGTLPLDELTPKSGKEPIWLQAEVQVSRAGAVEVVLESSEPATFWIDEEQFDRPGKVKATLSPGLHTLTVRVTPGTSKSPGLRAEVLSPSGSRARYEIVQAD